MSYALSNSTFPVLGMLKEQQYNNNNNNILPVATTELRTLPSHVSLPACPVDRDQFLIFVKILFRYMEKSHLEVLKRRAKAIVMARTQRARAGDTTPLPQALAQSLRLVVGNYHWTCALRCFAVYQSRATLKQATAAKVAQIEAV